MPRVVPGHTPHPCHRRPSRPALPCTLQDHPDAPLGLTRRALQLNTITRSMSTSCAAAKSTLRAP